MLAAFIPLWSITLLGWAAARFGWFAEPAQKALTSFAFHLAIPAVIFTTLVKLPLGDMPLRPLAAFVISTVIGFGFGFAAAHLVVKGRRGDRVIAAMASSYVNAGNLGLPVALYVLDDVSLIVAVVAFQTVLATPLIVSALDIGAEAAWRRIAWLPLRVPVVSASLLGTLFMLTGWHLPQVVLRPLEILGGAAAPLALFALGMALFVPDGRPSLRRPELGVIVVGKLILQPLVAYAAARWLFGLGGVDLLAVTIFAGLPTAQNTFVYATQYNVPNGLSRDAVLVTSVLSVLSLSAVLYFMTH